ncbi:hypothetical protein K7640_18325 [Micromonospora sp. PLK6-60]|uniref:hypothetical protein n=1 Tax=Micromonospora sp. PLK6-60 TaxID=2873383 RepID=UPI001CA670D8|nr:hypothetical protein [Micromonospora sp. PLK6-60]MBY8873788.1 hypothetical protein [Micromonospora sp. PLK6-60]
MAAGDGFQVTSAALVRHARSVDRIADEVGTAQAAAAQVRMGGAAYGKLPVCQAIPLFLNVLQDRAVTALSAAEAALHSAAAALDHNANAYDDAESGISAGFTGMYR